MALQLFNIACTLLFSMELYHMIAHTMIMCGIRTLPRKDLVKIRLYFLIDCMTVCTSSFLLTGKMKWLATIHLFQHLFYYATWDRSYMAKRIIDWSSLEWFKSSQGSQMDSLLGTCYDVVVHVLMMYALSEYMDLTGVLLAFVIAQAALYFVVFNPRYAWSSPSSIPAWVQKRLGKLALE